MNTKYFYWVLGAIFIFSFLIHSASAQVGILSNSSSPYSVISSSLAQSLMVYFPFNSTADMLWNSSINGINVSAYNSYSTLGKLEKAFYANGSNGVNTDLNFSNSNALTINLWFNKTGAWSNYMPLLTYSRQGSSLSDGEWYIRDDSDNGNDNFIFAAREPGFTRQFSMSNIVDYNWYMLTIVINGSTFSLYTNGVKEYNFTFSNFALVSGSLGLFNMTGTTKMSGVLIDELGVWNRTLNSTEISSLYNSGSALAFSSLNGSFGLPSYYWPIDPYFTPGQGFNVTLPGYDYVNMSVFSAFLNTGSLCSSSPLYLNLYRANVSNQAGGRNATYPVGSILLTESYPSSSVTTGWNNFSFNYTLSASEYYVMVLNSSCEGAQLQRYNWYASSDVCTGTLSSICTGMVYYNSAWFRIDFNANFLFQVWGNGTLLASSTSPSVGGGGVSIQPVAPFIKVPVSEIYALIKEGGSASQVFKAWNPQIYDLIYRKWVELSDDTKISDFLNNSIDMFFLIVKYLFRQPASLVGDAP